MRIKIDNTVYEIAHVYKYESDNCAVIRCSNQEFMLFRNASEAGAAAITR